MVKEICFQDGNKLYITDEPSVLCSLLSEGKTAIPEYDSTSEVTGFPHTDYAVIDSDSMTTRELYDIYCRINGIPVVVLTTEHMLLREMSVDDVPEFYKIYGVKGVSDYIDPLFDNPADEILHTRNYIKNIYGFYGYGLWTIVDKATGHVMGRAGLSPRSSSEYPDLGFVIAAEYQGRHLGYEIGNAILDYAKNELGLKTIQARVNPSNIKSVKLLEKLGFTFPHKLHQDCLTVLRTFS